MSSFKELIAAKPALPVFNNRETVLINVNNKLELIASLDTQ